MARKLTFDELLAKREQREADKLKVGLLELPGTGKGLEARMPGQKTVLDLYGELVAAQDARESLQCGNHALYACCPQLWDSRLQEELGCKVEKEVIVTIEERLIDTAEDKEEDLQPRAPVLVDMGHVHHGKTSLLH